MGEVNHPTNKDTFDREADYIFKQTKPEVSESTFSLGT